MKFTYNWIKEYVDVTTPAEELSDLLTMGGLEIEGLTYLGDGLDNIFTVKINDIQPHPDADKLIICQVDVGTGEDVQIVTGAPNVKEGDKVPVVLDGGRVAGGHDGKMTEGGIKIKKGKLKIIFLKHSCILNSPVFYTDSTAN